MDNFLPLKKGTLVIINDDNICHGELFGKIGVIDKVDDVNSLTRYTVCPVTNVHKVEKFNETTYEYDRSEYSYLIKAENIYPYDRIEILSETPKITNEDIVSKVFSSIDDRLLKQIGEKVIEEELRGYVKEIIRNRYRFGLKSTLDYIIEQTAHQLIVEMTDENRDLVKERIQKALDAKDVEPGEFNENDNIDLWCRNYFTQIAEKYMDSHIEEFESELKEYIHSELKKFSDKRLMDSIQRKFKDSITNALSESLKENE